MQWGIDPRDFGSCAGCESADPRVHEEEGVGRGLHFSPGLSVTVIA